MRFILIASCIIAALCLSIVFGQQSATKITYAEKRASTQGALNDKIVGKISALIDDRDANITKHAADSAVVVLKHRADSLRATKYFKTDTLQVGASGSAIVEMGVIDKSVDTLFFKIGTKTWYFSALSNE